MNTVEISHISKSFGDTRAVTDVTFDVKQGEIFGLLGPNGAGKTTTIRILLDIFRADQGQVSVFGGSLTDENKGRIGYMPEERGLYQDVRLERCLLYLASLSEVPPHEARRRLTRYLERFDLEDHKNKKVKELSKGMQQKAQIIATLLHCPELVVIDEPFTALDPLNTQLVKDLMRELREQGTTIIMSTHQMRQVEELCDRIVLIDKGKDVLYGDLSNIRRRFSGHAVLVRSSQALPGISGVEKVTAQNGDMLLALKHNTRPEEVLYQLTDQRVLLERFEVAVPSLDEIFIRVVEEGNETA